MRSRDRFWLVPGANSVGFFGIFGIFWDFLDFLGFFGIFWRFLNGNYLTKVLHGGQAVLNRVIISVKRSNLGKKSTKKWSTSEASALVRG